MGQTPTYALPWPEPTDPADGPAGFQALAVAVEAALSPPVTALPGAPYDGQIVRYKVGANGPVWTFVYLAASTAPRWHFLGGAPLWSEVLPKENTTSTVPVDLATVGPSVTLPLAGDYEFDYGAGLNPNTPLYAVVTPKFGAAAASDADSILLYIQNGGSEVNVARKVVRAGLAAGAVTKLQYRVSSGGAGFNNRYLAARPVRVT